MLVDKLRRPPHPDFRLLVVLPAKPNNGGDDTRGMLGELIEADDDDGRLLACTLYARSGNLVDPIYVHAKIGIVDDAWLTIGSANLNEHSLFNDTEMNVVTHDAGVARATRLRLWSEHLELPGDRDPRGPARAIDELWKPISAEQLAAPGRGLAPHAPARAPAERLAALRPRRSARSAACSSTADRPALLELEVRGLHGAVLEGERQLPARAGPRLVGLPDVVVLPAAVGKAAIRVRDRLLDHVDRSRCVAGNRRRARRAGHEDRQTLVAVE